MGCGASVQNASKEEPQQASEEVVTWATKTAASAEVSDAHGFSSSASQGGSKMQSKHEQNCILLDAEDNDEIEIIYEVQPKRQNHVRPAAANGQEAPEAAELDTLPSTMQPKPLSKQQQEEAAKLAERRKRFDNQRYQREQRTDGGISENGPPGPSTQGPMVNIKPSTDMILGLNLTDIGTKDQDPHGGFLPGGILDDTEEFLSPAQKKDVGKKNKHQHDEVKSSGFDADDERLMKEILENCDDV